MVNYTFITFLIQKKDKTKKGISVKLNKHFKSVLYHIFLILITGVASSGSDYSFQSVWHTEDEVSEPMLRNVLPFFY